MTRTEAASLTERLRSRAWEDRQHRELRAAAADCIEQLVSAAEEARIYFEERSDASNEGDGWRGNEESHLARLLREAINKAKGKHRDD